ncbi:M48 family metallopeptidase [Aquimarina spongiae]|uniref:Zn-dependent protease with chaperone function n=1 Tax=Aquimarina spongiae TaxID=570521 RepID=A0A1M6L6R9_9FLAO|nr:M48 family metallopeptidase [Aquimarina spongiae]SHJ66862.1 Zn-dependent protease with chaperone function [Aquimarina spongiae]
MADFYPLSPELDRKNFTKITTNYKKNVFVVLVGIVLFFALYTAAVAGSIYLFYLALTYDMGHINKLTILLKAGTVGMSGMFVLFMIKFIFKKQRLDNNPLNIEITEKEHPKLFQFIRTLSEETKAPFPKKIFVNHEINAAVFYNSTILSLFIPTRKNLLIGLGLVNGLNLTEFKAVLAHEFGHFSQSSMRLGSYVYMTNRIIYDMVNERDYWDRTLDSMKNSDIRIAIFAWLLMPAVWTTRQVMVLIYKGINLLQSSLSRQMEYHADLVAVSVTGSNAIVNGLYKLDATTQALNFASEHVFSAIQDKKYTSNLFYHQTSAYEYLKKNKKEFKDNLLENCNHERVFLEDDDAHVPNMYASHPSGYKREDNAKKNFVEGIEDTRSPWILFDDKETLCEKVTKNLITVNFDLPKDTAFAPATEIQEFIESEIEETQFDPKYLGNYDNRFFSEFPLENLERMLIEHQITTSNSINVLEDLYGNRLQQKMDREKEVDDEFRLLTKVLSRQTKEKQFNFRGTQYANKEAEKVYKDLVEEVNKDTWYQDFDKKVFAAIYAISNATEKDELILRYRFQFDFQKYHRAFIGIQNEFHTKIDEINAIGSLDENQAKVFAGQFNTLHNQLIHTLNEVDVLRLPSMNNTKHISSLKEHLLAENVAFISSATLDGQKLNQILQQLDSIISKSRRLYFKSLGNILKLQEKISTKAV